MFQTRVIHCMVLYTMYDSYTEHSIYDSTRKYEQ
jgi:hypothetical protein